MHGRLKVRTTEEHDAIKQQERAAKLASYRQAMAGLATLRNSHAAADPALRGKALQLSQALLVKQPDVATAWNFRRELLLGAFVEADSAAQQRLRADELIFLNVCLERNPKSYGAWHHRAWIMRQSLHPPWANELSLCAAFLQLDSRNFHCWDYRRFIVLSSNSSLEDELEFSMTKISTNFSNFSAWHYRSTLLAKVHGDPSTYNGVTTGATAEDFDLVKQAVYIDAADQSAWFYHRWLLGRVEKPPALVHCFQDAKDAAVTSVLLVFSQPVALDGAMIGGDNCAWTPVGGGLRSALWRGRPAVAHPVDPSWPAVLPAGCAVAASRLSNPAWTACGRAAWVAASDAGERVHALARYSYPSHLTLAQELASCEELLEELTAAGPASEKGQFAEQKWCRLSLVQILRGLEPAKAHHAILHHLTVLRDNDMMRRGCYDDDISRAMCEHAVYTAACFPPQGTLNLAACGLTLVHATQHWLHLRAVDLSDNALTSLHGLNLLVSVCSLLLDRNRIARVAQGDLSDLTQLVTLSLADNMLRDVDSVSGLSTLPASVTTVTLSGNAVSALPSFASLFLNCNFQIK